MGNRKWETENGKQNKQVGGVFLLNLKTENGKQKTESRIQKVVNKMQNSKKENRKRKTENKDEKLLGLH